MKKIFWPKSIFCNFKNRKSLKLLKCNFTKKIFWFIWFHEFFCLDFFKFSGLLCVLPVVFYCGDSKFHKNFVKFHEIFLWNTGIIYQFHEKYYYQWCFLVVIPNLVQHSSQTSPSPHFGSWLNESNNLISRVFVATWQLNIETPFWFKVPNVAPALTSERHIAPLPFM